MKHKRLIVTTVLSTMALFTLCLNYNPQDYDDENDFIVTIHDKTVEITGYKGKNTNVNIPPRIGKLPVTAIGQEAFCFFSLGSKKLFTSVKIPKGVTHIGEKAFYWNDLREIIIPDTVVSIGDDAFAHNKLAGVIIPDSVRHIGVRAFWRNRLKYAVIPSAIPEIGYGAFASNGITEIVLPDHITDIGYWMFKDNELTSIMIPEGVRTIGDGAFENNKFTELIIPQSVISIGRNAFGYSFSYYINIASDNRNIITKVTIGDNVELDQGAIRGFTFFYDSAVMKKGGTYIYSGHYWRPEDKSIPVYRFNPDDGWNSPDIKFLLDMPDLENVVLQNNDLLTDITPLAELKKIKTLTIDNCPNIKNIKPLSSLINLESLFLTHNNNYNYTDIAHLQKLEKLFIHGDHSGEIDLISIGHSPYLKFLTLGNGFAATIIKNINELQNMTNLEELHISGAADLDLSWAANLHNLITLELNFCTVNDISPLANLPNLANVDLTNNRIKDITSLIESNSIKYVRVFEDDMEMGINTNIRSQFYQKGIYLDTFRDTR